jgi:SAM-dependent methyltransferase
MKKTKAFTCMLCGSTQYEVVAEQVRDSSEHAVYACTFCSHVQLFPLPSPESNREFYNENRQFEWSRPKLNIQAMRKHLEVDTIRRADYVEKYLSKSRRILEIGTGFGFFMQEMLYRDWDIEGVEISSSRRRIAETLVNKRIYDFDITSEAQFSIDHGKLFDLVCAFQVLEHILKPREFISGIGKVLAPNGKLLLEVPNRNDHMLAFCKEYRDYYYQKAHVSYFSAGDLLRLLMEAGFEDLHIEYIQRYSVENAMTWLLMGTPQIKNPSFRSRSEIQWLDELYRAQLCRNGASDTFIVVGSMKGKVLTRTKYPSGSSKHYIKGLHEC